MVLLRFAFTLLTALAAADPLQAAPGAAQALASLAQRYQDTLARLDPVAATQAGDNRFNDQLVITIAPAQRTQHFAALRQLQQALLRIPVAALGDADALTHELLAHDLAARLALERFPEHLLPLQHMDSLPVLLANFGSGQAEQPLQTAAQYRAYLRRIGRLPAWADQAIANLREGRRRGIVQARA
ncbi:MAG: DUF885 family protein, partial [Rubrivivax sp.]